jgi:eukaryotic-like serine/threonine-protein kinase
VRYTSFVSPGLEVAKRFRLERQLGAGGMGAVWAATHLVTHKSVALKFLHKKHDDADARRRVLREARAACAVEHPNVVAVHDVVEGDDGTPILVMDLLRGESLADKLARERTLDAATAIAVTTPVLSALAVAHGVGIIHRDLKPDNVFLVDGVPSNVKILDFGVAKLSGKDAATKETNRLTETGAMIGTPHYMAPEQAFGESDVDARADLWAVGAVLYECLAGVPPTEGQNLGQILKVLASGTIQPLATRAPSVPPALAAVVDGLLKIEKAERPASAQIVLEQLAALDPSALAAAPLSISKAGAAPAPLVGASAQTMARPPMSDAKPQTSSLAAATVTPAPVPASGTKRGVGAWALGVATAVAIASAAGVFGVRLRTPTASAAVATAASTPRSAAEPSVPVVTAEPPVLAAPTASASAPPSVNAISASAAAKGNPPSTGKGRGHAPAAPAVAARPSSGSPLIAEPTF